MVYILHIVAAIKSLKVCIDNIKDPVHQSRFRVTNITYLVLKPRLGPGFWAVVELVALTIKEDKAANENQKSIRESRPRYSQSMKTLLSYVWYINNPVVMSAYGLKGSLASYALLTQDDCHSPYISKMVLYLRIATLSKSCQMADRG